MNTKHLDRFSVGTFILVVLAGTVSAELLTAANPPANTSESAIATEVSAARWSDIKGCNYYLREEFFSGLKRLEARLDTQITELSAKRLAMEGRTETKEWDFALKEVDNARANLKATREQLSKADAETWEQLKDKVGVAWVRTQDACSKVRASTTD